MALLPGPPPLTWRLDPARGGWTGVDPHGVVQARITLQAEAGKHPLLARTRSGWRITYRAGELDRARRAMDHVWAKDPPPPIDPATGKVPGRGPKRGRHKLRNQPVWAPHPGTLRQPPR